MPLALFFELFMLFRELYESWVLSGELKVLNLLVGYWNVANVSYHFDSWWLKDFCKIVTTNLQKSYRAAWFGFIWKIFDDTLTLNYSSRVAYILEMYFASSYNYP